MTLSVVEAAATYAKAMRNIVPAGPGVCEICHTFINEDFARCYPCSSHPSHLDVVVPITYSDHLGQIHQVLRDYKDGVAQVQRYVMPRLASILWLFLERHEACVAEAAGTRGSSFDCVATVPSSTPKSDERRGNLRWIVGTGCDPTSGRFERVLRPTGRVPPNRDFNPDRYEPVSPVDGQDVLLIDDTWTTGGHAQSAGAALKAGGAGAVGLVVIGRHVRRSWEPVKGGPTSGDLLDELPRDFDWEVCCVHV